MHSSMGGRGLYPEAPGVGFQKWLDPLLGEYLGAFGIKPPRERMTSPTEAMPVGVQASG